MSLFAFKVMLVGKQFDTARGLILFSQKGDYLVPWYTTHLKRLGNDVVGIKDEQILGNKLQTKILKIIRK